MYIHSVGSGCVWEGIMKKQSIYVDVILGLMHLYTVLLALFVLCSGTLTYTCMELHVH